MFELFADGSCLGNPGPGGYAFILRDETGTEEEHSGCEPETTNNRMELLAAIKGLEATPAGSAVKVTTDSQYLVKGMSQWIHGWKRNGWKNSEKKPVKNKDLWERLSELCQQRNVSWEWTEGHAGHPENERCDEMARTEAEKCARNEK